MNEEEINKLTKDKPTKGRYIVEWRDVGDRDPNKKTEVHREEFLYTRDAYKKFVELSRAGDFKYGGITLWGVERYEHYCRPLVKETPNPLPIVIDLGAE